MTWRAGSTCSGPRGDVPRLLSGADAVLVTSREEGRPGVILEAALGGLPVVAFSVGGVPDLVTHRVEGLLIPPGDVQSAATALNELLGDPALQRSLGQAARSPLQAHFFPRRSSPPGAPRSRPRWHSEATVRLSSRPSRVEYLSAAKGGAIMALFSASPIPQNQDAPVHDPAREHVGSSTEHHTERTVCRRSSDQPTSPRPARTRCARRSGAWPPGSACR